MKQDKSRINDQPSPIPRLDGETLDLVAHNIEQMKALFPDVFTEGKVDLDALRATLGDYADERQERYSFTWNGKAHARRIAQTPSTATLRPCPQESLNWDTTQNVFIEGENLEVLKLLQKSYYKKVKMIYIDPPYNTGKDFIYPDDFRDSIKNYLALTGQIDGEGRRLSTNAETSGRFHTDWLNMMYPRLKLARNLLREDGVIFISIDDNEMANLWQLCCEVFGEENAVSQMVVVRSEGGGLAKQVVKGHDYLIAFARNIYDFIPLKRPKDIRGKQVEWKGEQYWIEEDWLRREFGKYGTCYYDEIEKYKGLQKKKEVDDGLAQGIYRLIEKKSGKHIVGRLRKIADDGTKFYSILKHLNADGKHDLEDIEYKDAAFTFPKPVSLIKQLCLGATFSTQNRTDIILDFFSGSSTTAHAVLDLNSDDGGNRRFIMVQLPEPCGEKSEAFKAGYKSIADIGKERIRRVIKNLESEQAEKAKQAQAQDPLLQGIKDRPGLDLGFKVFKLDSSNIKPWDPDLDNLEASLWDAVENIKPDRSEADLLYELLLKYGLDLSAPIEERDIDYRLKGEAISKNHKSNFHIIDGGALIVCQAEIVSLEVVDGIAALKDELKPEVMRVLFKDSGFADDVVKVNAVQILRQAGIDNVKSV